MSSYPLLKIVIAGDNNVGKTSLVRRFCKETFEEPRVVTIGVDFQTKLVELPEGMVKLSIWDLAGQERFQVVREGFYRGSLVTALVYALDNPESLKSLASWYQEVKKSLPGQSFVVVGNKADLVEAEDPLGMRLASILKVPYLRTSALTGEGVDELFTLAASLALQVRQNIPPRQS
jgi:small GTP-binding protein